MGTKIVDPVTTNALIQAFDLCNTDVMNVNRKSEEMGHDLRHGWTGTSSDKFSSGLEEWRTGLTRVTYALNSIGDDINSFRSITANAEGEIEQAVGQAPALDYGVPAHGSAPGSWAT